MAEKLEDFNLPTSAVNKIIKEALPENVNISKDARTSLARAAAVFVLYVASHASQIAQSVNRKTLLGKDVMDALASLDFEDLIEPLNKSLSDYKEESAKKKNKKSTKVEAGEGKDEGVEEEEAVEENEEVEDE